MEQKEKILIMLVGKTHTGKTTFANEVKQEFKNVLILEADPIAVFMKENYPELRFSDDKEHTGEFKDVSLKFKTFLLFLEFAMSLNKPIMLSNSNMWLKGRELVFELCKKNGYKVIGIYLNLPEEILINRINVSERSTNVLRTSKSFNELILNQRERMQPPEPSDFTEFFECKSEQEVEDIKKKIINILK
jgi:predicted kinase